MARRMIVWSSHAAVACSALNRLCMQGPAQYRNRTLCVVPAEEFGLPYSEQRRNEMFGVVRDAFQQARAADPNSAAAGAMFWLPALEGEPNTDGLNVYLDGSEAPYPVESG